MKESRNTKKILLLILIPIIIWGVAFTNVATRRITNPTDTNQNSLLEDITTILVSEILYPLEPDLKETSAPDENIIFVPTITEKTEVSSNIITRPNIESEHPDDTSSSVKEETTYASKGTTATSSPKVTSTSSTTQKETEMTNPLITVPPIIPETTLTPQAYDCKGKYHNCRNEEYHLFIHNMELEGCKYCGSHSCVSFYTLNSWGFTQYDATKCPKYSIKNDPAKYCVRCKREMWSKDNPTGCFSYLLDTLCECGEFVKGNTCHHH